MSGRVSSPVWILPRIISLVHCSLPHITSCHISPLTRTIPHPNSPTRTTTENATQRKVEHTDGSVRASERLAEEGTASDMATAAATSTVAIPSSDGPLSYDSLPRDLELLADFVAAGFVANDSAAGAAAGPVDPCVAEALASVGEPAFTRDHVTADTSPAPGTGTGATDPSTTIAGIATPLEAQGSTATSAADTQGTTAISEVDATTATSAADTQDLSQDSFLGDFTPQDLSQNSQNSLGAHRSQRSYGFSLSQGSVVTPRGVFGDGHAAFTVDRAAFLEAAGVSPGSYADPLESPLRSTTLAPVVGGDDDTSGTTPENIQTVQDGFDPKKLDAFKIRLSQGQLFGDEDLGEDDWLDPGPNAPLPKLEDGDEVEAKRSGR